MIDKFMKCLRYLGKRIDHKQHGWWHLAHGFFPWWGFTEDKVESPDFDHVPASGRMYRKDYFQHLVLNYKCYARHKVMGKYPFMKVTLK